MGGSAWDGDFYASRGITRTAKGIDTFAASVKVLAQNKSEWAVLPELNPFGLKFRESRDSVVHPKSKAIAFWFDVTGSMSDHPKIIQKKLGSLMNLLIDGKIVDDPQVLFGAVGDVTNDKIPLQIGQFESGIEMEDDLIKIVLEGGGGSTRQESYELAMYATAYHTSCDCFEKRKEKGYCFIIGDEEAYENIAPATIEKLFGSKIGQDISLQTVLDELTSKFNFYFLLPKHTPPSAIKFWKDLIGSNAVHLKNETDTISELVAMIIGLGNKTINLDDVVSRLTKVSVNKSNSQKIFDTLKEIDFRSDSSNRVTKKNNVIRL